MVIAKNEIAFNVFPAIYYNQISKTISSKIYHFVTIPDI